MPLGYGRRSAGAVGLLGGLLGGRRGGGGGKIRILIAVAIALFGLVSYYFGTEQNPFTGEAQRVGNMSFAQEVRLGLGSAPQMVEQMGGAVDPADPRARLVHDIGTELLDASGVMQKLQSQDIPYQFSFTLIDDPKTVNAFALPGGPVFITTALFEAMEDTAQLAGVLGHEIGHVVERHSAQQMAKSQLGQSLISAVAIGASDDRGRGMTAAVAAQMAAQFLQLKYGRGDELESDRHGLEYMVRAGYDPREMVKVMAILKKASGGGGGRPEFTQTHPLPETRIEDIKAWVAETFPDGVPADLDRGRPLP